MITSAWYKKSKQIKKEKKKDKKQKNENQKEKYKRKKRKKGDAKKNIAGSKNLITRIDIFYWNRYKKYEIKR